MILKSFFVWLLIAGAETLHGILRVKLLNPRFGDLRARQLALVSGTTIILLIGWSTIPWINPKSTNDCISIGVLWLIAMLTFDIGFGRLYLRLSWKRIWSDFDIFNGGYLGIGMVMLFMTPWIVVKLHGMI